MRPLLRDLPLLPGPYYIVSGHPRSGTSLMMQGLVAGGLVGHYLTDEEGEPIKNKNNPRGFFEMGREDYKPDMPNGLEGKVFKLTHRWISKVAMARPFSYRIVFMLRRPWEINKSMVKVGNGKHKPEIKGWKTPEEYYVMMRRHITILKNRFDCKVIQVWYSDVLEKPLEVFQSIKDSLDLPIDPKKATSVVDLSLYRNRLEDRGGHVIESSGRAAESPGDQPTTD